MAHLAILGSTGAVGRELIEILLARRFSVDRLLLLGSSRSAGQKIIYGDRELTVEEVAETSFDGMDLVFLVADAEASRCWMPVARRAGARIIDNSSAFRLDDGVPLVVPEINAETIGQARLIANPNCSTIIMNTVVWPLHCRHSIERIVVSTYQAVSGAGFRAMTELRQQTKQVLDGHQPEPSIFRHPIAFNLFCHESAVGEDGYNDEERKMVLETRKIFGKHAPAVTATCVRVPILRAHSESINLTFREPMSEARVREILATAPGIRLVDDREASHFPMPVEAAGQDDCLVGRIRQDTSQPDGRGIELFVSGDQLRKGAALNAVQIAEYVMAT